MSLKALSMTYTARIVNAQASIASGESVLHLGCGDGYLDAYLSTRFKLVIGVDINFPDLRSAAGAATAAGPRYVLVDGFVLPFASGVFDEVVSIDVLEHAEDDVALLGEISRVLKAGGRLTLSVPNADYPLTFDPVNYALGRAGGRHLPFGMWGFGHKRLYNVESMCQLIESGGLIVRGVTRISHHLIGLVENAYLLNLVQPLTKSSAANRPLGVEATPKGIWRRLGTVEPPSFLRALRDRLIRVDSVLFGQSAESINFLVSAEKR